MAVGEVRVEGLRELQRSLNKLDKDAAKVVRDEIKEVAVPVKLSAEQLAVSRIRNIGAAWSRMRIGTRPGEVYIAPAKRRKGGSRRPNLGVRLMEDAMLPAVELHEEELVDRVDRALGRLGGDAGF